MRLSSVRLIRDYCCAKLILNGTFDSWSDERFLRFYYPIIMGKPLHLSNPKTFSEKLQWLKLYDRREIYTTMVDKAAAKALIAERVGVQHVIPALGVWDCFDQIPFDALPDRFVLKCTHDSGGMVVCRDKAAFDFEAARTKLERHLYRPYYKNFREWPYKDVPPRILAEECLIEDPAAGPAPLTDYKFFCFNGEPRLMYISQDRSESVTTTFFDMEYRHLPVRMKDPPAPVPPPKPVCFDEMKALAAALSAGIPHLRVDFYYIDGTVYVGELTFFHNAGFVSISPPEWERTLGDWIELPPKKEP